MCNGVEGTSLDAQETELLCLICQEGMWCISLVQDAWNLSRHCQATHEPQDTVDAGDASQDAQDTGHADSTSHASGRNSAISEAGLFLLMFTIGLIANTCLSYDLPMSARSLTENYKSFNAQVGHFVGSNKKPK